jgi:diguanylate cyclase (GGDEF)-like protein
MTENDHMPKKPGVPALRGAVALSTVLAVLLVLISVSAGAIGAHAWRASIRDQAEREFRRQASAVDGKVREHVAGLNTLFALTDSPVRQGVPIADALKTQNTIKEYPGVIAIGHAVGSPDGALRFTDEYSTVSAFGIVDLHLAGMVSPQMRAAIRQSDMTGQLVASARYDMHWFTANAEPAFFVVRPTTVGKTSDGWTVALVYGNWLVEDALQAAGSSFRAELLDGQTIYARDYLPLGAQATKPPPPIADDAVRSTTTIDALGRPLQLVVADTEGMTRAHIGRQPWLLFGGASLLGLLSGLLVWVLGRSRGRALRMVAEATAALRHQAFHDSLTGLANRALLADRMSVALARRPTGAGAGADEVAVLLCDLDDFKSVNDTLGHAAGDELLQQVAARLAAAARTGDTVARLGGDEFALLLEAPAGQAEARAVGERILAALREPVVVAGLPMEARASVGIAVGSRDQDGRGDDAEPLDPDRLLREADVAMYAAKRSGKTRCAVYEPALERSPRPVAPRTAAGHPEQLDTRQPST